MHIDRSKLVGVIDEGTNSAQFIIYKIPEFEEVASHQMDIKVITPKDGWVEQDPLEILETVRQCAKIACEKLTALDYHIKDMVCIGITNQRETTVVWDKITGKPLYHAIGWNDIRTDETVDKILAKLPDQNKNYFKSISGLTISPYFSALKLRWLSDNIPSVKKAIRDRRCLFGTIDSWLIWNLTGGPKGGLHVTDVTNASRTLLMNIETLNWDPLLTKTFSVSPTILPEIRSSADIIGPVNDGCILNGIPISGVLGNQQSSLIGQCCLKPGQTKNTYRSGCFLLCNTGEQKVLSTHGLVTTVAYKLGKDKPAVYALEGSVAVAGSALKWLQNNLKILKNIDDSEQLAGSVFSTGDVYFVPSFTGLYAPYWRKDARGIICGLTGFTNKNHLIRAALEAICFQTRDILEAMNQDCGFVLNKLNVDGKLSGNNLLMQLQSDLCGIPVFRAQHRDTTALGVAMVAAQADGINAFVLKPDTRLPNHLQDTYLPTTTDTERNLRYTKWKMAVQRSLGWAVTKKSEAMTDERFRLLASIPCSLFIFSTFLMLVHSRRHIS
ncbi:glycerol kinase [Bradysia coprophila]|uniref:glycerol kinase n=1 Tax=Bradysia coprophila TaxID=38358 RepID=UPI00187DA47B|nr:glycerol kinase [Bradysia coprophila]XP_037031871.1 glycerol kinase [Bradysia coprophila]XP_037031872.1 glycerol kinase [Bradysia coprophila]XP_037031874.1 glycerol kinase [Bradysia coprophila]